MPPLAPLPSRRRRGRRAPSYGRGRRRLPAPFSPIDAAAATAVRSFFGLINVPLILSAFARLSYKKIH